MRTKSAIRGLAVVATLGACTGAGTGAGTGGGTNGGTSGGAGGAGGNNASGGSTGGGARGGAGGTRASDGSGGTSTGSGGRPGTGGNVPGTGGFSAPPDASPPLDARVDQPPSTGADGAVSSDGASDTGTPPARPAACDRLAPLPVPYKVKRGPKAAEDFTFDREGNLISVDTRTGNLFKSPFTGKPVLFAPTRFMEAAGTRMLPSGDLVVAEVASGTLYKVTATGTKTRLASGFVYPNGIEVHLDGSIFVADQENRRVMKVDPTTGASTTFVSGPLLGDPNGVSFSPDYRTLYVGDFGKGRILAVDVGPTGTGNPPRVLAANIGQRLLDGLAVDECGNVYVDEYEAAKVWRISPDGKVSLVVDISKDSGWIPNMQWGSGIGGWDPNILYVSDREVDVLYEVDLGVRGKRVAHLP